MAMKPSRSGMSLAENCSFELEDILMLMGELEVLMVISG
jgi:hypothetical protein